MNLSPKLQKKLAAFSWNALMPVWYRHYKLMFFLLFLVVFGFSGYQWYYSLHRYSWTEEKKKAYVEANFKETSFKEKEFRELTERLRKRAEEHASGIRSKRNIFTGEAVEN